MGAEQNNLDIESAAIQYLLLSEGFREDLDMAIYPSNQDLVKKYNLSG